MNLDALFELLAAAHKACGHRDYVIIGSLSVLGMSEVCAIPADMTMSIDADSYTLADPARIFDLQDSLGEGSAFHQAHGYYLDPVSPGLPTLPEGWQPRLVKVTRGQVTAHFLEPNDAAVSKLARGEPRDVRWIKAGLKAGLVSMPTVRLRMRGTSFLDEEEQLRAQEALDKLAARARRERR
ncbi:MAG TPA: DUF6036 family nucleotidyltransferase [Ramlibacter sp.]|nr:DUF6036 family nucleotidyltransferase [Ramlibacter sp.]